MGLFDFGSKKKTTKKKSTKKSGAGSTKKKRKASSGNPKIGMISKRASRLYRNGDAKTWASAMRKAAKM